MFETTGKQAANRNGWSPNVSFIAMDTAWSLQYLRKHIRNGSPEDHQSSGTGGVRNTGTAVFRKPFLMKYDQRCQVAGRKALSRASSPPVPWSCSNTSLSWALPSQTAPSEHLNCCLLLHQPTELMVHQGGREKLLKNAVGTENLGHVSLESWASGKTFKWRKKGLVGGWFSPLPVNCNVLFADVKEDESVCTLAHV